MSQVKFHYTLYDNPELVSQVFARRGQIVYDYYGALVDMEYAAGQTPGHVGRRPALALTVWT